MPAFPTCPLYFRDLDLARYSRLSAQAHYVRGSTPWRVRLEQARAYLALARECRLEGSAG